MACVVASDFGIASVRVRETALREGAGGILRIDFGKPEDALEEICWEDFFEAFEKELASFCQDENDSRFVKFVSRG